MTSPLKVLILGGIKSGKTRYALNLIDDLIHIKRKIYIATSQPFDDEMKKKIEKHKKERDSSWITVETPLELHTPLEKYKNQKETAILIDCFTMWVNNMLHYSWKEGKILEAFEKVVDFIKSAECNIVAVSNEAGLGIVPDNKTARRFINYLGELNQKSIKAFPKVIFMISGIPISVKNS